MARNLYYVNADTPDLAAELEAVRVAYFERTGEPGWTGCLCETPAEAIEQARMFHLAGQRVTVSFRWFTDGAEDA